MSAASLPELDARRELPWAEVRLGATAQLLGAPSQIQFAIVAISDVGSAPPVFGICPPWQRLTPRSFSMT